MFESQSRDPRWIRRWKNESEVVKIVTHYPISSAQGEVIQLRVLIPRHDYCWIAEYTSDTTMLKVGNSTVSYVIHLVAIDRCLLENLTIGNSNSELRTFRPANLQQFQWQFQFLECDYEGKVWPFWDFYGEVYQPYNVPLAQNTLKFFRQKSLEHKVPLEIYAGTLLGWYRQGDFIPYSYDLDFAVNISHMSEEFFRSLWDSEMFPMAQRLGTTEVGLEINGYYANQLKVDIFSWNIEDEHMFTYYYLWNYRWSEGSAMLSALNCAHVNCSARWPMLATFALNMECIGSSRKAVLSRITQTNTGSIRRIKKRVHTLRGRLTAP